jgi:hypothetical protein
MNETVSVEIQLRCFIEANVRSLETYAAGTVLDTEFVSNSIIPTVQCYNIQVLFERKYLLK